MFMWSFGPLDRKVLVCLERLGTCVYIYMYHTTKFLMVLVYQVKRRSCRISIITSRQVLVCL